MKCVKHVLKNAPQLTCLFWNWPKIVQFLENSPSCHAKIFYELINTTKIVVALVIVQNFGSRAASLCMRILSARGDATFCVLLQQ